MKKSKKHRKLFYVPGMISLVLIPVLGLWFIKSNRYQLHRDYSVDFSVSDSISDVKPKSTFIHPNDGYVPKRNYQNFLFNGTDDDAKIRLAVLEINKLVKENDSINGLKFTFGKHVLYDTFIKAQDILFINSVNNYTVYKNDIYIFETPKKKTGSPIAMNMITCGFDEANKDFFAEELKLQLELFIQNGKCFWQVLLGFLGIGVLNVFVLIKFNRNRIYNQKSYI